MTDKATPKYNEFYCIISLFHRFQFHYNFILKSEKRLMPVTIRKLSVVFQLIYYTG
jgi:hypothetical protein